MKSYFGIALLTLTGFAMAESKEPSASNGRLFANFPSSVPDCGQGKAEKRTADFKIGNGLSLYHEKGGQKLYTFSQVSRSTTLGRIGYVSDDSEIPQGGELAGWSDGDDLSLVFGDNAVVACPDGPEGSHTIWLGATGAGRANDCFDIKLDIAEDKDALSCTYTKATGGK